MTLRELVEAFCETVDAAAAHQRAPRGGQSVQFNGDFYNAHPVVMIKLEWWARELRAAVRAMQ